MVAPSPIQLATVSSSTGTSLTSIVPGMGAELKRSAVKRSDFALLQWTLLMRNSQKITQLQSCTASLRSALKVCPHWTNWKSTCELYTTNRPCISSVQCVTSGSLSRKCWSNNLSGFALLALNDNFSFSEVLLQHLDDAHEGASGPWTCRICQQQIDRESLGKHFRQNHIMGDFECAYEYPISNRSRIWCTFKANTLATIIDHYDQAHGIQGNDDEDSEWVATGTIRKPVSSLIILLKQHLLATILYTYFGYQRKTHKKNVHLCFPTTYFLFSIHIFC